MNLRNSLQAMLVVFLAVIAALFAAPARAQTDRATLEGTVTDPSGGAISGAGVQVTENATGITEQRRTNSNGYYRFPGLAVGDYTVTVSNASFKTKVLEHVTLVVGETHNLDVRLEVGAIEDKVEIQAETGPAERTSAAAASVLDTEQIANLPVNGRDWSQLTLLAPFAQDDGGGDQRTIRFAGRARDDNNFNFDGVDAGGIQEQAQKSQTRLQISEDAVEEVRVNSALYDVEYGTQAGGQINVVTKSGSNDLHGTAFGYLRNSVFDARNFDDFAPDASGNPTVPKILPFRMGQYGLTVGGPIKKDKTFFFISYEGLRQLQESTSLGTIFVPSASLVKDILVNGRDDVSQTPAVHVGPSPAMCAVLQGFPWRASTGTVGGCAPKIVFPDSDFSAAPISGPDTSDAPFANTDIEAFTHPINTTVHEDTWLIRIDHKFSDKTTLYGRAQRDISLVDAQIGVTVGLDKAQTLNHPANYLLALQHIFSPNIFNEAKLYINRSPFHNPESSTLTYAVGSNNLTGIPNESADIEVGTTYGLVDNMTWTRGRHAFKMGMEIRRVRLNQGQTANNNLNFSDDLSMVSGTLSGISFIAPWCCHRLRRGFYMPYFQDEWKVTPTFTVTAGLRWDYYGVATEATNRTTVFDLNQFHGACLGSGSFNAPFPAPVNTPPCPTNPALYNPNYLNFDPRLSLAWAPSALHGKTVIRAGFGIYHGAAQNDDLNAGLESDTFRATVNQSLPFSSAYAQEIPDLSGLLAVKAANHPRALQRQGRRDLYAEEWGLTIEHELPFNFLLSTSYLGSHGVRLFSRGGVNLCSTPITPNGTATDATSDCVRPLDPFFPGAPSAADPTPLTIDPYGSVDIKRDIGSSTYHALGVSLERHFKSGLSFQSRYAYSHSINNGSVGGGESNGPENVNCLACDKGPSVFDIRHNFIANAIYELPFGPGKTYLVNSGPVLGRIVGGWSLSSVGMWHTGHPLTVSMGVGNSIGTSSSPFYVASNPFATFSDTYLLPDGNDQTNQRPDVVPGVPLTLPGAGHNGVPLVNPAAFQSPPVDANGFFTRFGNAGNGIIRALPSWQMDFAITKETKITERVSVEFGVQAFNILNHTQLGDPNNLTLDYPTNPDPANPRALVAAPNFGVITSTVNFNSNNDNVASPNTGTGLPRQLQFMLRFKF